MLFRSAQEFQCALLEASNKVIKCPECGAWHYPRKTGRAYDGCPWCDAPSKPKARLNFYDILTEGENYRLGLTTDGVKNLKLVNSYILREGKNQIKSLYVLRYDDPTKVNRSAENYLTIAKDSKGYWAYNEFLKDGIVVKRFRTGEFVKLEHNKAIMLGNGDYVYFELNVKIEVGGKNYSFIRMARFMEETQ